MASCPITSWQMDGETMEAMTDFILGLFERTSPEIHFSFLSVSVSKCHKQSSAENSVKIIQYGQGENIKASLSG